MRRSHPCGRRCHGPVTPTTETHPPGNVVVRRFFRSVPEKLYEAARIEGAGEVTILFRIVLPLSKAVLAVAGLSPKSADGTASSTRCSTSTTRARSPSRCSCARTSSRVGASTRRP
ncbi:ABC transporter permease subunit [Streptomyces sp. NPDC058231]|uniref:ABC transporter permease subunit n=1 Tax=Streptomyces sp. NPDC058231 TaxID=3346392 RepID=UPI0036E8FFF1